MNKTAMVAALVRVSEMVKGQMKHVSTRELVRASSRRMAVASRQGTVK